MKINNWSKIFNNPCFFYNRNSKKIKFLDNKYLINSYKLTSIVYPNLKYKDFLNLIRFQMNTLKIKKNSSLLDFGSGNGNFLYFFINKHDLKNNISLELSRPLISFQKKIIKSTRFYLTSNKSTKFLNKLKIKSVDYSMSNSVFQYFESENYAKNVIEFLINKTRKTILIFDIKNYKKRKNFLEQVRKRQKLSKIQFAEKYRFTPVRFYKKDFFVQFLNKLKKKYYFEYKFKNMPKETTDYKFGYCLIINKK